MCCNQTQVESPGLKAFSNNTTDERKNRLCCLMFSSSELTRLTQIFSEQTLNILEHKMYWFLPSALVVAMHWSPRKHGCFCGSKVNIAETSWNFAHKTAFGEKKIYFPKRYCAIFNKWFSSTPYNFLTKQPCLYVFI